LANCGLLTGAFAEQSAHTGGIDLSTKGDIHGYSNTDARVPIGSNNTVLTADSSESLGLKWAAVSAGATTNENNISPTNGQTETSATPNDITGGSVTLSNQTGGLAIATIWINQENDGAYSAVTICSHYDSAIQEATSDSSAPADKYHAITFGSSDNTDGGVFKLQWGVGAGTSSLSNAGNQQSGATISEVY